jgi:penicillin-binding protein 1A
VDPALPAPTLGKVTYTSGTNEAVIPMTVPQENTGDPIIFHVLRPDQTAMDISINPSTAVSTSITIRLGEKGKDPSPGDYVFTAAFKNRNGIGTGPPSAAVKLTLTQKTN